MNRHTAHELSVAGTASAASGRPQVVIVGAGFGGLTAALELAPAPVNITLIDRRNHHLFQPLLYQVATAGLSPADIAWPIRRLVRWQRNVRVLLGQVSAVDRVNKRVWMDGRAIPYDLLVIATGASHAYFGHDEWAPHAPGLKSIEDATEIRRRILTAFERAEMATDPDLRRWLLTFVVVGGGPTGVEMAGTLAELARKALAADFRAIDPRQARVVLVEAGSRVLPGFSEGLSDHARRALSKLGVEVATGRPITRCDSEGVMIGEDRLAAATVIWAAGVAASPVADWLGVSSDRAGRVPVGSELALSEDSDVFIIGDVALVEDADGRTLPGIAPVAKQQGSHIAKVIAARLGGRPPPPPFRYRDRGLLATIGRRAAVIEYGRLRLKGRLAWWLWGIAHIYFLISLRNRLIVATQWLWSYVTFDRGARLITGPASSASRPTK
ncbi:MAG: NAD(P)/FAD-dependent oxidoreductase [Rhizobiaceae bacterium]|nr:NAD(P)/FAD-dependent oxidoreductase [Rhizobiaceae bacterium]